MSRGIVSQRPFSRKKRKQSFRKTLNRSGVSIPEIKISKKLKSILSRGASLTILVICGIFVLIKSLFFKPEQTISQVKFSDDTLATYQDIELFNLISDKVKGKNYYILLSNQDELLKDIQKDFPFVGDIQLQLEQKQPEITQKNETIITGIQIPKKTRGTGSQTGTNFVTGGYELTTGTQIIQNQFPLKESLKQPDNGGTLGVQIMYYDPSVLVKINEKKYAVWNETTYVETKEGMLLGIRDPEEEPLFLIETPQYLTGNDSIDGFFFEISLDKFMQIISLAKEEFGNNMIRFVYLAGSTRFAIFTNDEKTLYFNFPEGSDIPQQRENQISKYNILREKYSKFDKIENIDLGALENNKVIIKNY